MSDVAPYPNDLAACHALLEEQDSANEKLASKVASLEEEVELLKRYVYGRRSERYVEDKKRRQLVLFDRNEGEHPEEASEDQDSEDQTDLEPLPRRKPRRKPVGEKFPKHLPRQVTEVDVPEHERQCSCCGETMPVIDYDEREVPDFIPAKLIVKVTRYAKRACPKCKGGVVSPPPQDESGQPPGPVKGGQYGFGVYAQVIVGKIADHLPLYRQEDVFARAGMPIARTSQFNMLAASAAIMSPLIDFMIARLLATSILGVDDTTVRLQDPSLPGQMRTARFWLYRGREDAPYNLFEFHDSRGRDGPAAFLEPFRGWATVDAYGVNDGIYLGSEGRIRASCCNSHARRKFIEARSNDPRRAAYALSIYRQLYDIEDRAREFSDAERLELRQAESMPLLRDFRLWLEKQRDDHHVLPKSSIAKAIGYTLNQWDELSAFTTHGGLPMDNNDTERELRRLTIGRKNWLFVGSQNGGEVAAKLYSVVSSAARHHLDLWAYVNDVLRRLVGGETDYEGLLPDRWKETHPESVRSYRDLEQAERAQRTKERRQRRRALQSKLGR